MLTKLYKSIFDISVCYTIGTFLMSFLVGITISFRSFLILMMIIVLSVVFNQRRKWNLLAIALILIVSLVLLDPSVPETIVLILISGYYCYAIISDCFIISRGEFVDRLMRCLYLLGALVILMITSFQKFYIAFLNACPYLLVAMVSAVFLLRHIRVDVPMEQMRQYRLQQIIELFSFIMICLLLTLGRVPQNLLEGIKQIYQHLIVPILSFIAAVFGMLIIGLINLLIAAINKLSNNNLRQVHNDFLSKMHLPKKTVVTNDAVVDWTPFLYSMGVIIVIILLYRFFQWLLGEKYHRNMQSGILETREFSSETKEKRGHFWRKRPKESREKVRYYYGKCMLWLQHKKVKLKLQDTTEEIKEKYYSFDNDERKVNKDYFNGLNQIYRRARYQMGKEITKDEAEKAKEFLQRIKDCR